MGVPFYVNPETVSREKADFARRNVARGRAVVALEVADGVLLLTENRSTHLRKFAELYDRIAYAGVGKYNEFESLRIAGVRLADMRGYSYGREDVTAKALANAYSQTMGTVFTNELKPYEVEILVAQVGEAPGEPNELYHIRFDGLPSDEHGFMAMGADAEQLREKLGESFEEGMTLAAGLGLAMSVLATEDQTLESGDLEAALLSNTGGRRRFRRLLGPELSTLLT